MSSTRIDQTTSSTSSSVRRRSSLVVNLSTIKKRSSMTRLLTSSSISGVPDKSRGIGDNCTNGVSGSYSGGSNSSGSSSSSSCGALKEGRFLSYDRQQYGSSDRGEAASCCPQSAPASLTKPTYCMTTKSTLVRKITSPVVPVARECSLEDLFHKTNEQQSPQNATTTTNAQVIENNKEQQLEVNISKGNSHSAFSIVEENQSPSASRRSSKEDSPEPIVEVKHTSSSSSSVGGDGSDSARSSDNNNSNNNNNNISNSNSREERNLSTKLVRRKTVRRYHRSTDGRDNSGPNGKGEKVVCTQLTVSINDPTSTELTTTTTTTTSTCPNEHFYSSNNQQPESQLGVQSQFRTRQLGSYCANKQQQQASSNKDTHLTSKHTSSSHLSSSSSKIAKCVTTTSSNSSRKSTHLVSQSLSKGAASEKSLLSSNQLASVTDEGSEMLSNLRDASQARPGSTMDCTIMMGADQFATSSALRRDSVNNNLFTRDKQSSSSSSSRRSIAVQEEEEEEESSVHHSRFSSSSAAATNRVQEASVKSERNLSQHSGLSQSLSSSSSRHFKHSSSSSQATSLFVSGAANQSTTSSNRAALDFQLAGADEAIFSSPDVRSLVKEIGIDFAELENFAALSSNPSANHHVNGVSAGRGSLSTRLFPTRRPVSPLGGQQVVGLSLSSRFQQRPSVPSCDEVAGDLAGLNFLRLENQMESRDHTAGRLGCSFGKTDELSRYCVGGTASEARIARSSGERISELLSRAESHAAAVAAAASAGPGENNGRPARSPVPADPLSRRASALEGSVVAANSIDPSVSGSVEESQHKNHCKAVMSESIERIDQRMSGLCKKFHECQHTNEAIDLLKVMIQTIEKAWSVPVCGDDLGFKLCNSLREAGGLDIILGFIQDDAEIESGEEREKKGPDNFVVVPWTAVGLPIEGCTSHVPAGRAEVSSGSTESPLSAPVGPTSAQAKNSGSSRPLKLNLSKLGRLSSGEAALEAPRSPPECNKVALRQQLNLVSSSSPSPSTCHIKDSDSEIFTTSDLGLDSSSVESLSYVSATTPQQVSSSTVPEEAEGEEASPQVASSSENKSAQPEDQAGVGPASEHESERQDLDQEREEAHLRKEELVFLSARLLSQCLTSGNRDYIVASGLESVIKLACKFTTMKSSQSQRLLSRSTIMRQSSSISGRALEQAKQQLASQQRAQLQQPQEAPVGKSSKMLADSRKEQQKQQAGSSTGELVATGEGDRSDVHAIVGTEILQHLFKHSEETCWKMISLGGLEAVLYGCRSSNVDTLRHCASALANLALYGGPESQQMMIEEKAHVWLFPLAFNEDDNIQYYACLAIVVLAANQEIEADVLKSSTLNLVEPFVTSHEPRKFAESTTSHIHGQSASWLRRLLPLLESKREEARNLACFHFAMEAHIKREQGQTGVFADIGALEPLRRVGGSPAAIASRFACQALRLVGEREPHRLSQQVPLWTSEDVAEWVGQAGFERFRAAFLESRVDGDLLLQLDEETLRADLGFENGILRRRFLRELDHLKRIADYSSADRSNLGALLASAAPFTPSEFTPHLYAMLQLGVSRDNVHLLEPEQLLRECRVSNAIRRAKLAHALKGLQERLALEAAERAASSELLGVDGPRGPPKSLDVFVSYRRSTGSQLASLLKVHLQLRGFSVFIDVERLEAGKFDNNLLDSIKAARNFVLVLSPGALERCINDHQCKDWVHKEIVAALANNCNIIPVMDNFHWPDADQLPEDMRSISYFNGVRWIHDYQEACVEKIERFIRGEISNHQLPAGLSGSTLSAGHYSSSSAGAPSMVATPSGSAYAPPSSTAAVAYSACTSAPSDYHPLSAFATHQYAQTGNSLPNHLRRPLAS